MVRLTNHKLAANFNRLAKAEIDTMTNRFACSEMAIRLATMLTTSLPVCRPAEYSMRSCALNKEKQIAESSSNMKTRQ